MTFSSISDLWNKWNTRGFVILSLTLQVFLTLFAPLRKKTTNCAIVFLLWLAYLMADWVAPFAIGLINQHQGHSFARAAEVDGALQAFWASFLLLHLGGQDTITAFSIEDSWLWQRHLLTLIFQVGAAIYVFVQLFPNDKSLVIPTILVFYAALIKNAERTMALCLSSLPKLRESMLTQHKYLHDADNKLSEELFSGGVHCEEEETGLDESTVVKRAYLFFQIFKVFVADLMFTFRQRNISRKYFYKVSAVDALRVISVELHFMYEVLHTKMAMPSKPSYICRFIVLIIVVLAFILFNRLKKHQLPNLDVEITYILLSGGIALEVIALLMLVLSDWTVAIIMCYCQGSSKLDSFLRKLVSSTANLRKPRFVTCEAEPNANITYEILGTPVIFQRWSECISACNLLSKSLEKCPRKMYKRDWRKGIITLSNICNFLCCMPEKIILYFYHFRETMARPWVRENAEGNIPMIENTKYVIKNPFMKKLWIFIFNEVRNKSENADDIREVKRIFDARGDQYLKSRPGGIDCDYLLEYVTTAKYDASIIIWHLATEICYNRENLATENDEREFSKILSDYMFYLILNQPVVMSSVTGIAQMRSMETLRELWKLIPFRSMNMEELCRKLIELSRSDLILRSQLVEGTKLATELDNLEEIKWKVMSGVWVEMLSYAAIHIKGETHVRVLSKGGELLAFVWLLMVHFGCFYKSEWGIYYENWYERSFEVIGSHGSNPHLEQETNL